MDRPIPLGFSDEPPPPDGTAPYAGSRIPGPLGTVTDQGHNWSAVPRPAVAIDAAFGGSTSPLFAVGADTYRLRRTDSEWRASSREVAVPPQEAREIIGRATVQHRENVALLRLLETAGSQLAGLHEDGTFVLVLLRPQLPVASLAASPPAPPPPAPRPRAAPLPQPPAVEVPAMAAAQAAVLKNAAASGAPFCEECARAAAAQQAAAGA